MQQPSTLTAHQAHHQHGSLHSRCLAPRHLQSARLQPVQQRRRAHSLTTASQPGTIMREVLTGPQRVKLDATDDRNFYSSPRIVKHVDDGFLAQVTQLYRERIPDGGDVLDLMSSWVSHLPGEVKYRRVVGHGMNAAELAKNKRLDSFFVRDLNKNPDGWALDDQSFDAVLCCVSVQYLQQPERVFAEIHRVLRPGGCAIFTFSNRMFYDKAITAWRDCGSGYGRCQLVKQYFAAVAGFGPPEVLTEMQLPDEGLGLAGALARLTGPLAPLVKLMGRASSDPFYAVIAYRED